MTNRFTLLLATTAFFLVAQQISAQHARTMMLRPGADGIFRLQEVETIFTSENDTVRALIAMPAERRLPAYSDVDIRDGDQILLVNGERIKTVWELETLYKKLPVGKKLKMGILRKGKLRVASLVKADPASFPADGAQMQIVTSDGATRPWLGTGLMLGEDDGLVYVDRLLYENKELQGDRIGDGDELVSLNGAKINDLDQLLSMYEKIPVGSEVKVVFSHNNKKMHFAFKKPEASTRVIRR